jgi:hypothetical protein
MYQTLSLLNAGNDSKTRKEKLLNAGIDEATNICEPCKKRNEHYRCKNLKGEVKELISIK